MFKRCGILEGIQILLSIYGTAISSTFSRKINKTLWYLFYYNLIRRGKDLAEERGFESYWFTQN